MMGLYQLGAVVGSIAGAGVAGALMGAAGWRWTFYVWIPVGAAVAIWALLQPEPPRGERDAEFERQLVEAEEEHGVPTHRLPPPSRTSDVDYRALEGLSAFRELWRSRTFRVGTLAVVVVQMLPIGLGLWAIPFFKRVHHLSAATAGSITGLLAAGTIVGVIGGGMLADRLLERGIINARVWVFLAAAVVSGLAFMPAFAVGSTAAAAALFFVAATFLGITIAPGETMVTDVVVAPLRGRASTIRFSAGALSAAGAAIIGGLSSVLGLRVALVVFSPVLALGALLALPALRSYGPDIAFVVAESRRARLAGTGPDAAG
jgi:MFS family permease